MRNKSVIQPDWHTDYYWHFTLW